MKVVGEAEVYCAAENGRIRKIRVILSPDLTDIMLLGWQSQMALGLLHSSWPKVLVQTQCHQVNHEENEKQDVLVEEKKYQDFPVDGKKFKEVRQLLEEYKDIFHDELDTSDRLVTGKLDLKLK